MVVANALQVTEISTERVLPSKHSKNDDDARTHEDLPDRVLFNGQDVAMPRMYMHLNLFFNSCENSNLQDRSLKQNADLLRKGLENFLAWFPAAAGEAKQDDDGRWYLYYNGQGAELILAESPVALGDSWKGYGGKLDSDLAPRGVQIMESSDPVFTIKLTRFTCGSLCLSTSTHHWVVDFVGYYDMMRLLASSVSDPSNALPDRDFSRNASRLVEGVEPKTIPSELWFKERSLTPGLPAFPRSPESCRNIMLLISGEKLEQMKSDFVETAKSYPDEERRPSETCWISTFDSLHALLWFCITQTRGLSGDTVTKLHTPVDARPYLPKSTSGKAYVGNVHPGHVFQVKASELSDPNGLFTIARRIRTEYLSIDVGTMSAIIHHHNSNGQRGYLPNHQAMFGNDVTISNVSKVDWSNVSFGPLGAPSASSVLGIPPAVWGNITVEAADGTALIVPAPGKTYSSRQLADKENSKNHAGAPKPSKKDGVVVMIGLKESDINAFLDLPLIKCYTEVLG